MTKEEAISLLTQVNKILINSNSWLENTHEPLNMAFEMAIQALEQKQCEDYISRQAAIATVCNITDEIDGAEDIGDKIMIALGDLPSISTEKTGRWIDEKVDGGRKVYCSKCNGSAVFEYVNDGDIYSSYGHGVVKKTKYCPNCGTKMLEVEE